MQFIIERENIIKSLQQIVNLINNRPILPILKNVMISINHKGILLLTSTDLEIEIITKITLNNNYHIGEVTVPGRKLFDICRKLPSKSIISAKLIENHILIKSDNSIFSLLTLPACDFPKLNNWNSDVEFFLSSKITKFMLEKTQFSMANNDVRFYLNGMLLEIEGKEIRTIATDGHRLAMCSINIDLILPKYSVILPRKGVIELLRVLDEKNNKLCIKICKNNVRICYNNVIFTSKVIDSNFPNYRSVLHKNTDKIIEVDRDIFKSSLNRVAILSNEKFKSVQLYVNEGQLKITTNNQDKEKAEETIKVCYTSTPIKINFNISYLLDVLNVIESRKVCIHIIDSMSSIQIKDPVNNNTTYIVMPMRL